MLTRKIRWKCRMETLGVSLRIVTVVKVLMFVFCVLHLILYDTLLGSGKIKYFTRITSHNIYGWVNNAIIRGETSHAYIRKPTPPIYIRQTAKALKFMNKTKNPCVDGWLVTDGKQTRAIKKRDLYCYVKA